MRESSRNRAARKAEAAAGLASTCNLGQCYGRQCLFYFGVRTLYVIEPRLARFCISELVQSQARSIPTKFGDLVRSSACGGKAAASFSVTQTALHVSTRIPRKQPVIDPGCSCLRFCCSSQAVTSKRLSLLNVLLRNGIANGRGSQRAP